MKRLRTDRLPLAADDALPPGPSHHLLHVLRAAPGTPVLLFDGRGTEQEAELIGADAGIARVRPRSDARTVPTGGQVELVLALLKHQAMDLALRMAIEAGARVIHPVITARSVAKGERTDRWARIASAAASQCGRADEPVISPIRTLGEALDALDVPLRLAAPGAPPALRSPHPAAVCVGPEGGFTPAERGLMLARGAVEVGLGPYVLRAETAAAVAVASLWEPGA